MFKIEDSARYLAGYDQGKAGGACLEGDCPDYVNGWRQAKADAARFPATARIVAKRAAARAAA